MLEELGSEALEAQGSDVLITQLPACVLERILSCLHLPLCLSALRSPLLWTLLSYCC